MSLPVRVTATAVSSSVDTPDTDAVGASFVGRTVTVIVAAAEVATPSDTVNVKVSVLDQFAAGV